MIVYTLPTCACASVISLRLSESSEWVWSVAVVSVMNVTVEDAASTESYNNIII